MFNHRCEPVWGAYLDCLNAVPPPFTSTQTAGFASCEEYFFINLQTWLFFLPAVSIFWFISKPWISFILRAVIDIHSYDPSSRYFYGPPKPLTKESSNGQRDPKAHPLYSRKISAPGKKTFSQPKHCSAFLPRLLPGQIANCGFSPVCLFGLIRQWELGLGNQQELSRGKMCLCSASLGGEWLEGLLE